MDYIVDAIFGRMTIDPDAGGQERRRERRRSGPRRDAGDSVEISPEARVRSAQGADGNEPEEEPAS
jgi:hypothetical protein